jgi:hypothetical protein
MHPFDELEAKSYRFLEKLCEMTNADLNGRAYVDEVVVAAGLEIIERDSIYQYLIEQGLIRSMGITLIAITSPGLRRLKEVKEGRSASGISPSVVYNISGSNARVNINSHDASVNVMNVTVENFFSELNKTIQREIPGDRQRSDLLHCVEELKRAQDRNTALHYYQQFISLTADHIAVFQPFLSALTQWINSYF